MYTRIPWELVADSLGSAGHNLGTTGLDHSKHIGRLGPTCDD